MPRRHVPIISDVPYFITARCINREWFRIPIEEVWGLFEDYLFFAHHAFNLKIHAFVLMSNHYHLLATPLGGLSETMNYFMRETSRLMSTQSNRINQVYGGPYHKSLLTSEQSFLHAYKYLYRNPVEAGLSQKVETYPYSTLQVLLGQRHSIIPLQEDTLLFESPESHLTWLNTDYKEGHRDDLRKALRRSMFTLPKSANGRRPSPLETELS